MSNTSYAGSGSIQLTLNYGTPLILLAYYLTASVHAWSYPSNDLVRSVSRRKRTVLKSFGFVTTSCYLVQSISYFADLAHAPDDGLIHSLSQTLVWISFSLISLEKACLVSATEKGFLALNFLLELGIFIVTFPSLPPSKSNNTHLFDAIQVLLLACLSVFGLLTAVFSNRKEGVDERDERQPLLTADTHGLDGSVSSVSSHKKTASDDVGYDSDGSDESASTLASDEEDRELHIARQQHVNEAGGWIGYLRSFRPLMPYLIPTQNFRLQMYVVAMILCTLLKRIFNVLHPRQLGILIDVLSRERRVPWKDIFLFMAYEAAANDYCGFAAVSHFLEYRIEAWSRQQLTVAALDHVMGLSMEFHDQKDSGEVIKAIEQAGSLTSLFEVVSVDVVPGMLDILIALWYVTQLFDVYAMLIVVAVGIGFMAATYYGTINIVAKRRISSFKDRLRTKIIYESVSNWYTVMCMNIKGHTMSRLSATSQDYEDANVVHEDAGNFMFVAQDSIEILGRLAITILAARRIVTSQSTVGDFVTLESYWETISDPLNTFARSSRQINSDLVDAERLLQLFREKPTVEDRPDAQDIDSVHGTVTFDNVEFSYPGRDVALSNINITAKAGQMIALVGETGSGKSTMTKLLMRFYDVTGGSISIDGHDIRDITLASLRNCFGFVPQDTILFNLSILENVRHGHVTATDEDVYAACRAAAIHDKILGFPNGYASKVGERGVKLSGGERQRIAIARVFLKNPQIVLLDEATSAMDSQTEARIQTALKRLIRGRTTFVIAHRLSTIVEADQILVLHGGRVVETGSHEELLRRGGRYSQLWMHQLAGRRVGFGPVPDGENEDMTD